MGLNRSAGFTELIKTKLRKLYKLRKLNALLQYKIPQNVGIEDKIVGPLSLRQLIIIFAGGGISYTIFAITSRLYELNALEYFVISIPTLIALAAALIRIHNVSFTKYVLLALEFSINPKKRMWDHRGILNVVDPDLTEKAKVSKDVKNTTTETDRKNLNLSDLSATLDSGGFAHVPEVIHKDIDAVADDDLITEAYFGNKRSQSSTANMYWRTRDVQKKKLGILAEIESKKRVKEKVSETLPELKKDPSSTVPNPPGEMKNEEIKIQPAAASNLPESKREELKVEPAKESPTPDLKVTINSELTPKKVSVEEKEAISPERVVEKKLVEKTEDLKPQVPTSTDNLNSTPVLTALNLEKKASAPEKNSLDSLKNKEKIIPQTQDSTPLPIVNNESSGLKTTFILNKKELTPKPDQIEKTAPITPAPQPDDISPKSIPLASVQLTNPPKPEDPKINREEDIPKKSKRRRKRKKKRIDLPVRQDTQIDNTIKNQPAKIIPKTNAFHQEDVTLEDLRLGNEIEINLD